MFVYDPFTYKYIRFWRNKMKRIIKIKVHILILGIFLALSLLINTNLNSNGGNRDKSSEYRDDTSLDNENMKLSKVSGKIHIINNSGWVAFKNAGNCTGQGTYSDPYVIEELEIDGGGTGNCIWIENSNVFFRIENCILYNCGDPNGDLNGVPNAGIRLSYVNNSQLIKNDCSSNFLGIGLSYGCNNNTISENLIDNEGIASYAGIGLWYSDNNSISGNRVYNSAYGITLLHSNNNSIRENTVNNGYYGISLRSSNNNKISGNIANENDVGIYVYTSYNNTIEGNIANKNDDGIELYRSNNNEVMGNILNGNTDDGIYIQECNNNTITNNMIKNNQVTGLSIVDCTGSNIHLNCFINNNPTLHINAIDVDGSNNKWDNGTTGNYWDDYTGLDEDDDGIGDVPYYINGSAGNQDNFPLMTCPIPTKKGGGAISGYNLFLLFGILSVIVIFISKKIKSY